ncbi:AI-2E family transporter [Sesbania bispinosa]|nr:AI-2E family transporter [Sesbania bispinosa]
METMYLCRRRTTVQRDGSIDTGKKKGIWGRTVRSPTQERSRARAREMEPD